MPSILVWNLKGGVGKTVLSMAIAEALACTRKERVLVIDADPQSSLSMLLLGAVVQERAERNKRTFHDLLAHLTHTDVTAEALRSHLISPASNIRGGLGNLYMLSGSRRLAEFSANMAKGQKGYLPDGQWVSTLQAPFKRAFAALERHFSYIIVDCPPTKSIQMKLLLGSAQHVLIPCIPDDLSVPGAESVVNELKTYRINFLGTVWNLFKTQAQVHRGYVGKETARSTSICEALRPFSTTVANSADVMRAVESCSEVPKTYGLKYGVATKAMGELCREILARVEPGISSGKKGATPTPKTG